MHFSVHFQRIRSFYNLWKDQKDATYEKEMALKVFLTPEWAFFVLKIQKKVIFPNFVPRLAI